MLEIIQHILQFIQHNLFSAFGIFSLLYPLGLLLPINAQMKLSNKLFCYFTISLGVVYSSLWIILIVTVLMTSQEPDSGALINRMFGPYWFGFWFQIGLWVTATQILRRPQWKYHSLLRVLIGLVLWVPLELVMVLLTNSQREFVRIDFSQDVMAAAGALLSKSGMFFCFALLYQRGVVYWRRLKFQWQAEVG